MDDIRNDVSDITKQNFRTSEGTLYRKVLGEIVFPYGSVGAEPALTLGRVGSLPRASGLRGPPSTKKGASGLQIACTSIIKCYSYSQLHSHFPYAAIHYSGQF